MTGSCEGILTFSHSVEAVHSLELKISGYCGATCVDTLQRWWEGSGLLIKKNYFIHHSVDLKWSNACVIVLVKRPKGFISLSKFFCVQPTGGMFEYVSGANYLGEIMEWTGFALAGHSIHSLSFALFTTVILSSRAVSHHK